MEYNASSIKVLSQEEIRTTQAWAMAGALSAEYPNVPLKIIQKAMGVIDQIGGEYMEYYVNRYLKGDRTIPLSKTFSEAYKHA